MQKVLLLFALSSLLFAESFNDFLDNDNKKLAKERASFTTAKQELEAEFKNYQAIVDEEFKNYKKELGQFWSEPKVSTKTTWVEYSKDKLSRKTVDFKNETITIEVNAKDASDARKKIAKELINAVTATTQEAYANDELSQRIDKRLKKSLKKPVEASPILAPFIFKKVPTVKEQVSYAKQSLQNNPIQATKSKVPHTKHFTMQVKMPSNTTLKRSKLYLASAKEEAKRFNMPLSLVMAIMHSESSFNPMARSHIPAYGLMQIVPRSAGADTYQHLYNQKRLLSASYLYNPQNNIKIGTAYLNILYYKYLKAIKNPTSRLYATIAAYNTGAGNVARTFSGTNNPNKAAKKINTMSSSSVYSYLRRNLKYKETRNYLKKVSSRVPLYKKLYGDS